MKRDSIFKRLAVAHNNSSSGDAVKCRSVGFGNLAVARYIADSILPVLGISLSPPDDYLNHWGARSF